MSSRLRAARSLCILAGGLLLTLSLVAAAESGVVYLDQSRALAGLGGGDGPGFPITLHRPGRYALSGDLEVAGADSTAIEVHASDVSIDLAGFEIRGPVTCRGKPVRGCTHRGRGDGVHGIGRADRVAVRGGTITGMGDDGVDLLGHGARVDSLLVRANAGAGIRVGIKARVRDSAADRNGSFGIGAGGDSTLKANRAHGNRGFGIGAHNASLVEGCVSYENGSHGFFGGAAGRFVNSSALDNGGDGFRAGNASSIEGNTINFNAGWAIRLTRFGRYSGNRMTGNRLGAAAQGIDQGANICDGTPRCTPSSGDSDHPARLAER